MSSAHPVFLNWRIFPSWSGFRRDRWSPCGIPVAEWGCGLEDTDDEAGRGFSAERRKSLGFSSWSKRSSSRPSLSQARISSSVGGRRREDSTVSTRKVALHWLHWARCPTAVLGTRYLAEQIGQRVLTFASVVMADLRLVLSLRQAHAPPRPTCRPCCVHVVEHGITRQGE